MTMVVACNRGYQRSVAIVELLKSVLQEDGFEVTAHHLHLHGGWQKGPRLSCNCRTCGGQDITQEYTLAWNEAKDRMRQVFRAVAD